MNPPFGRNLNDPPYRRVIIMILDGAGVGELPDAERYGDEGASTIPNTARVLGGITVPNLESLGLGNIVSIEGVKRVEPPSAFFGRMGEVSPGKDTITGHWEMMGLPLERPFTTFPAGFPERFIREFEERTGRRVIGNRAASGTEIIKELGGEHLSTGSPIVYTSADSVFQIAAHEEVIPLRELYEMCSIALELLLPHNVSRVIARPFRGEEGRFFRTENREDFPVPPPRDTILDKAVKGGLDVLGIGKIKSIFAGRGINRYMKTGSNPEGIEKTLEAVRHERGTSIIFTNLVDFDMGWGHRRDPAAFARGLREFDGSLEDILDALLDGDLFIVTADHGCDPTFKGTDHTREYVPLLVYDPCLKGAGCGSEKDLGTRGSFSDLGASVAEGLGIEGTGEGESFLPRILRIKEKGS